MTEKNTLLLHVAEPALSARFYAAILGEGPLEESPTFVFFALPSGLGLGLWKKDGVVPASAGASGASELGIQVETPSAVDALCRDWQSHGAEIVMAPADLDFGRSFVAADPDGHRLRVYAMFEEA